MRYYVRTLFMLVIAAVVASCRGGSSGGLPPMGTRHIQASTVAPSVTQWTSGSQFAPASLTVSWATPPGVGDLLVVAFWNNGQSSGAANTYTAPTGWGTAVDQNTAQTFATYEVFTHVVASGETNSYAFRPLAPQREHLWIAADVVNAGGVDQAGNAYINNGTAFTTPTLTPSQATDSAIAFNFPITGASVTWTNSAGWSLGSGPTSVWHAEAVTQALSAAAPIAQSATLSAAANGFSGIVLLTPSGVQSTPTPTPSPTPTATATAAPTPTPTPGGGGGGGGPAPNPTQWTSGAQYAPASIAVSWPGAPSTGDMLVVALWNNGQSSGAANTYTPPAGWTIADQNSSVFASYQLYWHVVASGESHTYTFVPQAAQREQAWVGVDVGNAASVDGSGDRFISNSTSYGTPSLTPRQSNDLAVAFNLPMTLSAATWTNPAGWSLGTGPSPTWRGEAVYEALSSGAAVSESSTLSTSASGFSAMILITSGTAGPTPTPSPTSSPTTPPASIDWSTYGFDMQRTGYNPNEKTIGTGSFGTLHPLWNTLPNVGSFMQGEPVVAMNVNIGGVNHNVLYAGGGGATFYAIDADTGSVLWSKQLGTVTYTCPDSGATGIWGIEGTAALDRPRNRLYVPDGQNMIHALDLSTGAEASGYPTSIAPVTAHDFIHVAMNYNASNGILYAETSSSCDISPWYGRIAAITAATGAIINTFFPNQGSSGAGIWGAGGASIDPATNNVFVATGNADSTSAESMNYSEHIVELSPDLSTVIASNFPPNMPVMFDSDFGATPLLFQPVGCPPLLAAMNKSGAFILYNRSNISAGPTQEIVMASTGSEFRNVPSYDPITNYVYIALPDSYGIYQPGMGAFSITASCTLNPTPVWNAAFGQTKDPRSTITIANGVAYEGAQKENTMYAYDATSGAFLWSGSLSGSGQVGPVVINGRLYVGDVGGTIHAWAP